MPFPGALGLPGAPMLPPRLPILPGSLPGMPLPGALPFLPPRLPVGFPFPARPLTGVPGAATAVGGSTNSGLDPNNDIKCWAEHTSDEGRKYWYNSVTFVSTYEKPFCLKTPEERSIPPCPWKEYFADGKVYYSDGKESRWDMPEEFRLWKEKVDALEKKIQEDKQMQQQQQQQQLQLQQQKLEKGNGANDKSNNFHTSGNNANGGSSGGGGINPALSKSNSVQNLLLRSKSEDQLKTEQQQRPIYATPAEAAEAFKDLLTQKNISTIAKMKEVQDLCQADPRWEALKTMGERKQALAEYQTKKLKLEKEAAKQKARKHKDAFLLMLAENTDIDCRTKWRDAIEILKDDQRFKNVEDSREREDLFRDFILELEKKEKQDLSKQRQLAFDLFEEILQYLTHYPSSSTSSTATTAMKLLQPALMKTNLQLSQLTPLTFKANWNTDYRPLFTEVLSMNKVEFRVLNENDLRKYFLDYLHRLEEKIRLEEKKKKEEHRLAMDQTRLELRNCLEELWKSGNINAFTRWNEFQSLPQVIELPAYKELHRLITVTEPAVTASSAVASSLASASGNNKPTAVFLPAANPGAVVGSEKSSLSREEEEFQDRLREMFDEIIGRAQDQYKDDRRVIKKYCWDHHIDLLPEMKYAEFKELLLKKARLTEVTNSNDNDSGKERFEITVGSDPAIEPTKNNNSSNSSNNAKKKEDHPEEGEEIEEDSPPTTAPGTAKEEGEASKTTQVAMEVESSSHKEKAAAAGEVTEIQSILLSRPFHLKDIFDDLYDKMITDYEEEKKRQKKLEDRYISLLKEYFYLSDHVGVKWDDAKQKLQGRSAYEGLNRADRKRLFYGYMDELSEKLKQKALSMKQFEIEPGEYCPTPQPVTNNNGTSNTNKESRKRDRSNSSTEFEKLVRMKK